VSEGIPAGRARRFDWRWRRVFLNSVTVQMDFKFVHESGDILLEQKLPTTPEAMKQTFESIPRSLIAVETGTACGVSRG